MSQVPAILAEVKAMRVEAEKAERMEALLAELKVPWCQRIWGIWKFWVIWAAFFVLQFVLLRRLSNPPSMTIIWVAFGTITVISVISTVSQMREREKAWRELLARKAPELLRETYQEKGKGANWH